MRTAPAVDRAPTFIATGFGLFGRLWLIILAWAVFLVVITHWKLFLIIVGAVIFAMFFRARREQRR